MARFENFLLWLDDWRVYRRLKRVERILRARDVSGMPNALQEARARHLDDLHRYIMRGRFPRNHEQRGYAPCFIDRDGRECAVAHLVMADGFLATAHKIADSANYAYVPEMKFPELDAWAAGSGFTKDELALIQPSYVYDPELRELLPQLWDFAFSVGPSLLMALTFSLLGVIVSAFNVTRIRHRRGGTVAPVIALALGLMLMFSIPSLVQRAQLGSTLLYPFRDMQGYMVDIEIVMSRTGYAYTLLALTLTIIVAGLCVAVGLLQLYLTRRWLAREASERGEQDGLGGAIDNAT